MSERMYTLWREGKIIFAGSDLAVNEEYFDLVSAGMWFLHGKDNSQFDFRLTEMLQREDGIPVHAQKFKLGAFDFTLECFSDFGLAPRCFVEARVENSTAEEASETLSFLLRTAKEAELVFGAPDVYVPYAPDVNEWYKQNATWRAEGDTLTDGERRIKMMGDIAFDFSEKTGIATARLNLAPGEVRVCRFAFDVGEVGKFDYEAARAECISAWERELAKINKLPETILADGARVRMIKNLTVQLLQCFTRPRGHSFVLARQGGLQRQVWAYETMPVLEALWRIGDFDDYVEPIIEIYFNEFYNESGEITPFAIPWAMATANVLTSFGNYALYRGDREYFKKYADRAYRSFLWIKGKRLGAEEAAKDNLVAGLFPPMRSCDDEFVFQSWAITDTFNIRGLSALGEAFAAFGDERAAEILAERDDYLSVMRSCWRRHADKYPEGSLTVPFSPSISDEVVSQKFSFSPYPPFIVECLDIDEDEVERIIATYTERGMTRGGLYDRMPDKISDASTKYNLDENGKCLVWYVANQEYLWFKYFLRHGMCERCLEILDCNESYAMSDEYYMQERYNQRNPYFNPWSPNASANGRTICMLMDFAAT